MKIAVCGIGVAGGYLLSRLKDEHEIVGFERMTQEKHDSICAWGASKNKMSELCDKSNINFEDFIIHDGKNLYIDMNNLKQFDIKLKGLCTYDKIGLIHEMSKDCKVHYGVAPKLEELEAEYDMIIDATGFYRTYLPKPERDFYLPTYQYKIEYEDKVPMDDFYVRPFPYTNHLSMIEWITSVWRSQSNWSTYCLGYFASIFFEKLVCFLDVVFLVISCSNVSCFFS